MSNEDMNWNSELLMLFIHEFTKKNFLTWHYNQIQIYYKNVLTKKICTTYFRDEFELEFSGSSCEVTKPRAGALQFSSWNRADNIDNMYAKKSKFLTYFPILLLYHDSNQFHAHLLTWIYIAQRVSLELIYMI